MKKILRTLSASLLLATALVSQNSYAGAPKIESPSIALTGSVISVAVVTSPIWGPIVLVKNASDGSSSNPTKQETNAEVAFANQEQVVVDSVRVQEDKAEWVLKRNDDTLIVLETPRPTQSALPEPGQTLVVNQTELGIALTQEDAVWFYFYNQKGYDMLNSEKL